MNFLQLLDSAVLAGDNVTAVSNTTASQLLNENELVSGEINASAPAPEEIQMEKRGADPIHKWRWDSGRKRKSKPTCTYRQ